MDEPISTLREIEIEGEREGRRSPAPWPCPVTPTPSPCCATASANYADAFCINHPGLRFEVARGARLPHCQSALPLGRSEWSSPSSLFSFPLGDQEAVGTPAQCSAAAGPSSATSFLSTCGDPSLPPSLLLLYPSSVVAATSWMVLFSSSLPSLPLSLPSFLGKTPSCPPRPWEKERMADPKKDDYGCLLSKELGEDQKT